jgi:ABC-type sulfate/molybdate transport systems ATPase subunit
VAETVFLSAEITHRMNAFRLEASFQLTASWTVLFGPSGAGKSTILRVLSGLLFPQNGHILLHHHTLLDTQSGIAVTAGKRSIGFLTQQPALFPHMTVRRNIAFGLGGLARDESNRRVQEMLELFRLNTLSKRLPAELSGGEYQRVALARSLAPKPALLLLDEPFSGLDSELKASILVDLTAWLKTNQVPALYVSHDLVEAYQTNAEVIIIENGKVETQGPVHEVLAQRRQHLLQQLGVPSQN